MAIELTLERDPSARLRAYPEKATRALVRALNRGINSGRTFMVQKIAADMGMKSKDVRDALPMKEATATRLEARLAASLKKIPVIDLQARGPEPSRGRGRGVSYRLNGSRERIADAFIATMPTGHRGVFGRDGRKRLGIHEKRGPSIGHVFSKYQAQGIARAQEMMAKNLQHELSFESADV